MEVSGHFMLLPLNPCTNSMVGWVGPRVDVDVCTQTLPPPPKKKLHISYRCNNLVFTDDMVHADMPLSYDFKPNIFVTRHMLNFNLLQMTLQKPYNTVVNHTRVDI